MITTRPVVLTLKVEVKTPHLLSKLGTIATNRNQGAQTLQASSTSARNQAGKLRVEAANARKPQGQQHDTYHPTSGLGSFVRTVTGSINDNGTKTQLEDHFASAFPGGYDTVSGRNLVDVYSDLLAKVSDQRLKDLHQQQGFVDNLTGPLKEAFDARVNAKHVATEELLKNHCRDNGIADIDYDTNQKYGRSYYHDRFVQEAWHETLDHHQSELQNLVSSFNTNHNEVVTLMNNANGLNIQVIGAKAKVTGLTAKLEQAHQYYNQAHSTALSTLKSVNNKEFELLKEVSGIQNFPSEASGITENILGNIDLNNLITTLNTRYSSAVQSDKAEISSLAQKLREYQDAHANLRRISNYREAHDEIFSTVEGVRADKLFKAVKKAEKHQADLEVQQKGFGEFQQIIKDHGFQNLTTNSTATVESLEKDINNPQVSQTAKDFYILVKQHLQSLESEFASAKTKTASVSYDKSTKTWIVKVNYQHKGQQPDEVVYSQEKLEQEQNNLSTVLNQGLKAEAEKHPEIWGGTTSTPNTPADTAALNKQITDLQAELATEKAKGSGGDTSRIKQLEDEIQALQSTDSAKEKTKLEERVAALQRQVDEAKQKAESWIAKNPMLAIGGGVLGIILSFLGGMFVSNNNSSSSSSPQQPAGAGAS
jgi:phage host-nuclease inhibitor protein Gam